MTEDSIRFKIIGKYENFIEKRALGINVINDLIEDYNLDPCDPKSFTVVIDKLKIELNKIIIPEQIGEKKNPVEPGEYFDRIEDNIKYKSERLYNDYTEKQVQELIEKRNILETKIYYLSEMLEITKFYLPPESKAKGESEIKRSKQKSKMEYGLLETIVTTIIKSAAFKNSNIEKGETLNQKQQTEIYKLAQKLFPGEVINKSSLISKVKQKGYSKELRKSRKSKSK